jgi:excinuclease UvrABC nuclease subunit
MINLDELPKVSFRDKSKLPQKAGVYIALNPKAIPLYVGMARNLKRRFTAHHRLQQLSDLSCSVIAWIEAPLDELPLMEKQLIESLSPKLNKTSVPRVGNGCLTVSLDQQTMQVLEALSQESGESVSSLVSRVLTRGIYDECEARMEALGILDED